jgi:phosphoenolpyruvate carboxylase
LPGAWISARPAGSSRRRSAAADQPLIEDIRLLGQILGDTVREQEGAEVFELIETIRRLSVAISRDGSARRKLSWMRCCAVSRPPMRSASSAPSPTFPISPTSPRTATTSAAARRMTRWATGRRMAVSNAALPGSTRPASAPAVLSMLDSAWLAPVLTAHPTEVQRKSILDAERAIAALLAARDSLKGARDRERNLASLRVRVAQLWQTRLLRTSKLSVSDEIENALSYYRDRFCAKFPAL